MTPQQSIFTLTILATLIPFSPAIAESRYDTRAKFVDKQDVSYPNGAALAEKIGKNFSVKGKLTKIHDGRIGITEDGKPDVQISIDPVKLPKFGRLQFKCVVQNYRPKSTRTKYHYHGAGDWPGNSRRQEKLNRLINGCEFGDSVELTGTLCHLTSTTTGNVATSIGYPNVPDSHFFFSIDDVTLTPTKSSPRQR